MILLHFVYVLGHGTFYESIKLRLASIKIWRHLNKNGWRQRPLNSSKFKRHPPGSGSFVYDRPIKF